MKALSVLGTSSGAGKSWVTTALCAWLRGDFAAHVDLGSIRRYLEL